MPTINLGKKKRNPLEWKLRKENENYKYVYHTKEWIKLRQYYIARNPLCVRCLEKGIFTSVRDVHHKIPLSSEKTKEGKQRIGFDINNLEGLCFECHINLHKNKE